jgi:hypothetical protein
LRRSLAAILIAVGLAAGCASHTVRVEPVHVDPIYMNVDVNIRMDPRLEAEVFDPDPEPDDEDAGPIRPRRPR